MSLRDRARVTASVLRGNAEGALEYDEAVRRVAETNSSAVGGRRCDDWSVLCDQPHRFAAINMVSAADGDDLLKALAGGSRRMRRAARDRRSEGTASRSPKPSAALATAGRIRRAPVRPSVAAFVRGPSVARCARIGICVSGEAACDGPVARRKPRSTTPASAPAPATPP